MHDTTAIKVAADTLITRTANDPVSQQYLEILEKTNSQLSLWTNPYGLMVGALALLFTVLTIIAVWITYRQSQDFKAQLQSTIDGYSTLIDELMNGYEKKFKALSQDFEERTKKQIDELEERKAKSVSQDEIDKINERINEVQDRQETMKASFDLGPSPSLARKLKREASLQSFIDNATDAHTKRWRKIVRNGEEMLKCSRHGIEFKPEQMCPKCYLEMMGDVD
jgi:hypothetical protein